MAIDHIMFNKHLILKTLLDVPSKEIIVTQGGIPNSILPSDHIRLEAAFEFKKIGDVDIGL